jgi:tetratricopeptide (TPR) repeat protein
MALREKRDREQAVPRDWLRLLNDHCDIDLAFEALEGWEHFHTDTNRGRLRSLQLRPQEAWGYFRKAEARAEKFELSPMNLLRRFCLKVYRFDNALSEESGPQGADPGLKESCFREVLRDRCQMDLANHFRLYYKGMNFLHREEYAPAKRMFQRLIKNGEESLGDDQAAFYLGAAVACRGLGEEEEADRQLENACLCIPALESRFNMGLYSGVLSALLRIWNRDEESREWEQFLVRLKMPKKTTEVFLERSRRIVERTVSLRRVFLF